MKINEGRNVAELVLSIHTTQMFVIENHSNIAIPEKCLSIDT